MKELKCIPSNKSRAGLVMITKSNKWPEVYPSPYSRYLKKKRDILRKSTTI